MNVDLLRKALVPKTALVVYEAEDPSDSDYGTTHFPEFYVETHSIMQRPDGKHYLGEGSPITYEGLGALAKAFQKKAETAVDLTGIFPENLLFASQSPGSTKLVWFDKPMKRRWLGPHVQVTAPSPAMLYYLNNTTLHVYAMDCKGRPKPDTEVYQVGWSNISGSVVCMGSASHKKHSPTYQGMIEQWTAGFWHTEFTGLQEGNAFYKHLKELEANPKAVYPVKSLKKLGVFASMNNKLGIS